MTKNKRYGKRMNFNIEIPDERCQNLFKNQS